MNYQEIDGQFRQTTFEQLEGNDLWTRQTLERAWSSKRLATFRHKELNDTHAQWACPKQPGLLDGATSILSAVIVACKIWMQRARREEGKSPRNFLESIGTLCFHKKMKPTRTTKNLLILTSDNSLHNLVTGRRSKQP
jgi:hypothetical protein